MIVGLGVDLCEVARIRRALEAANGARFRARVFTAGEQAYCEARRRGRFASYAARFAAKEAAMKALGTGHSHGVLWRDVEVVRLGGPPQLHVQGGAASRFKAMGGVSSLVTITHSDTLALAQVIILGD